MTFLIIENEYLGHHITLYLKSIIKFLLKKNIKIKLLVSENVFSSIQFSDIKKVKHYKKIKVYTYKYKKIFKSNSKFFLLIEQIRLLFIINLHLKKISYDKLYFNTLSSVDKALSVCGNFFRHDFYGFLTNLNLEKKFILDLGINKYLFFRLLSLKRLKKLFLPDPILIKKFKNNLLFKKIFLSIDFGHNYNSNNFKLNKISQKIQTEIKRNRSSKIIVVYGHIRDEKCYDNLLKVLITNKFKRKFLIIFSGIHDKKSEKKIKNFYSQNNQVLSINSYINQNLQSYLFNVAHYVWIGYKKDYNGSSSTYFLANQYEKSPICSNHGLLKFYNNKYKTGYCFDLENTNQIKKFLNLICSKNFIINKNKYKKINSIHNEINFSKNIFDSIIK